VLLRAGGSGLATDMTALAEDLASHGYFVVGFDAPQRSFVVVLPGGRVVSRAPEQNIENAAGGLDDPLYARVLAGWTSDAAFVADWLRLLNADPSRQFAGRLDLRRLGMVGHSFGGATALQFCHDDARCRAAIDLDGIPFGSVVRDGLAEPAMFLLSDHTRDLPDPSSREVLARIDSIYRRLPPGSFYAVIRGANHFSFSDQILLNSQVALHLLRLAGFGALDSRRGLAVTADSVRTFFDAQLNGSPPAAFAELAANYPELQFVN